MEEVVVGCDVVRLRGFESLMLSAPSSSTKNGGKEGALHDTLLRTGSDGGQKIKREAPSLLDTLLSKRSDDDQEMKIWRPFIFFGPPRHSLDDIYETSASKYDTLYSISMARRS